MSNSEDLTYTQVKTEEEEKKQDMKYVDDWVRNNYLTQTSTIKDPFATETNTQQSNSDYQLVNIFNSQYSSVIGVHRDLRAGSGLGDNVSESTVDNEQDRFQTNNQVGLDYYNHQNTGSFYEKKNGLKKSNTFY